jgi:polyhydroxyalkanoate synthesis repressor PhaR
MPIIKRYPNRKLYDTDAKKYITLDGIASLIRQGQEVQVVDHTSGEDLTALTLSQIIFEQEKKGGGFLPKSVLTSLVQAGGDTMNSLRRGLTAPLDLFRQVDDEIERRLQTLINRGELAKEEGIQLRTKLLNLGRRHSGIDEADLEQALEAQGVPKQEEIQHLSHQIESLSAKLDTLLADDS